MGLTIDRFGHAGFQTGTTNTFLYNGQVLANYADVVVVSIKYARPYLLVFL